MSLPEDKYKPTLPEDYFNKFQDKLDKKLVDEDVFQESEYPILFSLDRKDDFSVPDDYLDKFNSTPNKVETKSNSRVKLLAAIMVFITLISTFALSINKQTVEPKEIDTEEVFAFFDMHDLEDLYDDEIEMMLSDESDIIYTGIEEDVLLDYLIEDADEVDLAWLY